MSIQSQLERQGGRLGVLTGKHESKVMVGQHDGANRKRDAADDIDHVVGANDGGPRSPAASH